MPKNIIMFSLNFTFFSSFPMTKVEIYEEGRLLVERPGIMWAEE